MTISSTVLFTDRGVTQCVRYLVLSRSGPAPMAFRAGMEQIGHDISRELSLVVQQDAIDVLEHNGRALVQLLEQDVGLVKRLVLALGIARKCCQQPDRGRRFLAVNLLAERCHSAANPSRLIDLEVVGAATEVLISQLYNT